MADGELAERLTLGSLCRLESTWIDRVERSDRLGDLALRAIAVILVGAGAYGFTFGFWRGSLQGMYAAVKLPLLLLLAGAVALVANALVGMLLGARLSLRQAGVSLLLALAITASVLGSLAPISLLLVCNAPSPDPLLIGLAAEDPLLVPSLRVAQTILLWHVFVVGTAGVVGVMRLRRLLSRLVPNPAIARRVLWSWIALVGLAGAELSWLLRPFLGKPHLEESFIRAQALRGNFFEEMGRIFEGTAGAGSMLTGLVWGAVGLIVILSWLRGGSRLTRFEIVDGGMLLSLDTTDVVVRWNEIIGLVQQGGHVRLVCQDSVTLRRDVYVLRLGDHAAAAALLAQIEAQRCSRAAGAFRTPA